MNRAGILAFAQVYTDDAAIVGLEELLQHKDCENLCLGEIV
jgi:hypothetical protein